ncbi:twin-arginine translocation signal domain-containing protein [Marinilabiliaceae bacterium JC017]|nr:twin-arginine translocation signal domain-containing protein [Marinilabiliaceae bacterium JC017]
MQTNRRNFIKTVSLGTLAAGIGLPLTGCLEHQPQTLTVLHTNDVHSHIDPFPADHPKLAGKGGAARRAQLIKTIRNECPNVLLVDAGDIFQGTPFFNFFKGELEIKLMNQMQYDAVTLGNHEFDNGTEALSHRIKQATFPFICSNYNCSGTPLQQLITPYKIINKGELKIGLLGLGVELDGLVDPKNYKYIRYLDPLTEAEKTAAILKEQKGCDFIVCLSHLGYRYKDATVSDTLVAKNTKYIDLIIGGHTHTFMDQPEVITNQHGKQVTINQAGFGGIQLGRLDFTFNPQKHLPKAIVSTIYHV